MIYCDRPTLDTWENDPKGIPLQAQVRNTRVRAGDLVLCNSLEYAEWEEDPIIPIVCDLCMEPHCGGEGVAHCVKHGEQLIWIPLTSAEMQECGLDHGRTLSEPVVIPTSVWRTLRRTCPSLPPATSFPGLRRRNLARLFQLHIPEAARKEQLRDTVDSLTRDVAAASPIPLSELIALLDSQVRFLDSEPDAILHGQLVPLEQVASRMAAVNLPRHGRLPLAVLGRPPGLVLDERHAYVDAAIPV
jgi:hypothetical protein